MRDGYDDAHNCKKNLGTAIKITPAASNTAADSLQEKNN
jgi:hypothetical protein